MATVKTRYDFLNSILDGKKVSFAAEDVRFKSDGKLLPDVLEAIEDSIAAMKQATSRR